MQILILITAFVSIVSAVSLQSRQGPPTCAGSCITNANLHGCDANDPSFNACLCKNNDFVTEEEQCFRNSCKDANQLQAAFTFADQLCRFAGVTLSSTPSATPTSTGSSTGSNPSTPSSTAPPSQNSPDSGSSSNTGSSNDNAAIVNVVSVKPIALLTGAVAILFTL